LKTDADAQEGCIAEPGLDLHEWQTRWEQLSEVAEESPADAVTEMDRLLEEMLQESGASDGDNEATKLLTAAREAARSYEAGDASAGDLAHAINCYRELYELLTTEELDQQQRTPGSGRSA
jgi:hypothetical protein